MSKINIKDILKKGAKLKAIRHSKKDIDKFLAEYNKANSELLESIEIRKRPMTNEDWHKQITI